MPAQAVTFHNQRDFIFVRHHRYVFDEVEPPGPLAPFSTTSTRQAAVRSRAPGVASQWHRVSPEEDKASKKGVKKPPAGEEPKERVKARLQELGPRFTLKLRWLQQGSFDTLYGEYEWIYRRAEMDTCRRKFQL